MGCCGRRGVHLADGACDVVGIAGSARPGRPASRWDIRGMSLNGCGVGEANGGSARARNLDPVGLIDASAGHIADGDRVLAHCANGHVNKAPKGPWRAVGRTAALLAAWVDTPLEDFVRLPLATRRASGIA